MSIQFTYPVTEEQKARDLGGQIHYTQTHTIALFVNYHKGNEFLAWLRAKGNVECEQNGNAVKFRRKPI